MPEDDFVKQWLEKAEADGLNKSLLGILREYYEANNFDGTRLAEDLQAAASDQHEQERKEKGGN